MSVGRRAVTTGFGLETLGVETERGAVKIDAKMRMIGLPVTHIATYCIKEVADYVTLAILNASRRFVHFHDAVIKDKEWRWDLFLDIRRFECETVGLYGFGNIPRLVAERLQPFGCKILAYDPYIDSRPPQQKARSAQPVDYSYQCSCPPK